MSSARTNLLGYTLQELSDFSVSLGGSRYRGRQIFQWLYTRAATDFGEMTDLAKEFRSTLDSVACIRGVREVLRRTSEADGTIKFLFALEDGAHIESVLISARSRFEDRRGPEQEEASRLTLCVSTQVGCPVDCQFCATASMGFLRNLTPGEIVSQVLHVNRVSGHPMTNVVFMGMGEPLMNYENVMKAADILADGAGIAARRITISTAGWADRIRRMADEGRKFKLAVSLHSAVGPTREKLVPLTKRFGLTELGGAIDYYYRKTGRRLTFEHVFFDGVNDSEKEVRALMRFVRRVPSKVNVIPFHPIGQEGRTEFSRALRPSPRMDTIVSELRKNRITVFVRSSAGKDIDAACGQLAVKTAGTPRQGYPSRHAQTGI